MKKAIISKISEYNEQNVIVDGWTYNSRRSGKIGFLSLRDGFGIIQCIVEKQKIGDELFESFKRLHQESSISVIGKVVENSRAIGGYEILVEDFTIHQLTENYPITPKEHGTDFLMNHRHLWLRSKKQHSILKIRHQIVKAIRDFFDNNDFTLVDTPIFTPNAAEGTSTLFETNYFDSKAYLCQTGQLYGEASAMAFGRHYNFGPCFRAEKSKTRRHLTEFWMVEPEIAYADINDNMEWAERLIAYIVKQVLDNRMNELNVLGRDIDKIKNIMTPFPRVSYTECIEILNKSGNEIKWGEDFGSPEETYIANQFDKPVIVYGFPSEIKAFYMKRDPNNEKVVLGMDILAPEGYGEIIGGSEREVNINTLLDRIKEEKLNKSDYEWFLDLRRYGSVPHSGFGMGLERVVAWICGISHIRETIPFARTMNRINP
ncbi:MAG: asparagine--tRNA ligase [Candidatus Marinimicrobia bacterium]|nr:asparagine--tRNA ligase [Candidatus Neomarinimicrobiota bacterium]|tara:strand:- start:18703 stop:19995 length:1293 start_codon:yes stop_codon:yes gene_type:complete